MSGSLGGNASESSSKFSENVWAPQGDALEDLWSQGNSLFGGDQSADALSGMAPELTKFMESIMNSGFSGMNNQMGGGSYGDTSEMRNSLMNSLNKSAEGGSQMGNMYESIVGGPGNTYIDPMVDSMKSGMMDNLDRMQAGTGLDAAAMGQGGSNRHAMQNAMQGKEVNQDMANTENMMRGTAYDRDLNMKMDIARMADTNMGATQDRMANFLNGADNNMNNGMNSSMGVQNLGMGSYAPWMMAGQQPWNMYNNYSNSLGDPTVLGSGKSDGSSWGFGASAAMSPTG